MNISRRKLFALPLLFPLFEPKIPLFKSNNIKFEDDILKYFVNLFWEEYNKNYKSCEILDIFVLPHLGFHSLKFINILGWVEIKVNKGHSLYNEHQKCFYPNELNPEYYPYRIKYDTFGKSIPVKTAEKYGITAKTLAQKAEKLLKQKFNLI